jgi:hypothetical protein
MRTLRSNRVVATVVLAGIALGCALAVCVVFGPAWTAGPQPGLTTVDRLKAENDIRLTLLQGLGGVLALGGVTVGALMTLRQVRASREGHLIDLFTKAIDQLASDRITVRHGGVYALEQLSELDPRYRGHAHALLTAFVRQRAPWPPPNAESTTQPDPAASPVGFADDVAGAIGVLGRQVMIVGNAPTALDQVDLRGADLDGLDIPRAYLDHSNLDDARLIGAKLGDANLAGTSLRNADLTNADLRTANLTGANLDGAVLRGADLSHAQLANARLTAAIADQTTKWPTGFGPPRAPTTP